MKKNHSDITVVLDRSGSMESIRQDTIGGFNRFLKEQQAVPGTCSFTLNQFDDFFETVQDGVDIQKAKELTPSTFVPRGSTALLDAVGRTIMETGKRLDALADDQKPEKVIFLIVTDGGENASREYSALKVKAMTQHQIKKYDWQFVYLGANQDAFTTASAIGVSSANSANYAANGQSVAATYAVQGLSMRAFRTGQKASMAFTKEEREAMEKGNKEAP